MGFVRILDVMRIVLALFLVLAGISVPYIANKYVVLNNTSPEIEVLVVGDMQFDRYIRHIAEQNGYESLFSCVREVLGAHDVVMGNLEGPITTQVSVSGGTSVGDPYNTRFTFDSRIAEILARVGFEVVSIGNNHIYDFGIEGIRETRLFLDRADLAYVGDPTDSMNTSVAHEVDGVSFVVVAYNAFGGSLEDTLEHIRRGDAEGPVVVMAHWGEEYVGATDTQKELARLFVGAGADAVFGTHPHVIQEVEYIDAVPVYYSLGNFIFDQYFSPEVMEGLGVSFTLSEEGVSDVSEIRFSLQEAGAKTCPIRR